MNKMNNVKIRTKIQKKYKIIASIIFVFIVMTIWLTYYFATRPQSVTIWNEETFAITDILKLNDNLDLYQDEDTDKVWNIYITIYSGSDAKTGEKFTLETLNEIDSIKPDPILDASAYIVDPASGNMVVGNNTGNKNAIISQRGQSARTMIQKSYKVKLTEGGNLFKGQSTLNLNKHYGDKSRVAQKFSFDLMKNLPNIVSLRTNFFRVYIKDGASKEADFVDYGLFTHTEQPNKTFLRAHNLDPSGTLYKPTDFEFFKDKSIISEDDSNFNEEEFSNLLKIRENSNTKKLAKMLDEINNSDLDFNKVFEKYFDRDNYLTWCAMNLLLNNYDTMSRNFLLYSPSYTEKWYFLPWDFDKSMLEYDYFVSKGLEPYLGISRYWGAPLHRRFYSIPENVDALYKRIHEMYELIMSLDLDERSKRYLEVVNKIFFTSIDYQIYPTNEDKMRKNILGMRGKIITHYNSVLASREKPMPFFLGKPKYNENDDISFNWSPSYDLQGDSLRYDVAIFTDITKENETRVYANVTPFTSEVIKNVLSDGKYFLKVKAIDNKGNFQISFDRYLDNQRGTSLVYFGVMAFEISGGRLVE